MQGNSVESRSNQGDGIYKEAKGYTRDEDELSLLQHENACDLDASLDANHNLLEDSDTIDEILEVLCRELEHLDQLRAVTNNQEQILSQGKTDFGAISDFESFITSKRDSKAEPTKHPLSIATRKFILNNYIESSIKDRERDCNCQYHLEVDDDQCPSELSEFYCGKLSPSESSGVSQGFIRRDVELHKQQVTAGTAGGANFRESSHECSSGSECRKVSSSSSLSSSGNNRRVAAHSCSRLRLDEIDESAKGATNPNIRLEAPLGYELGRQYRCRQPPQLWQSGTSGLFIDSQKVGATWKTRPNDYDRNCLSASSSRPIFCGSNSERNLNKAFSGLRETEFHLSKERANSSYSTCIAHSSPDLSTSFNEIGCTCHCDCHHSLEVGPEYTPATNIGYEEEEEEEENDSDLLYETRSALDCVEESPPNNELSILSTFDHREESKKILDTQLFCSLTSDSAGSRQNSPSRSFLEGTSLQQDPPEAFGLTESSGASNWELERRTSQSRASSLGDEFSAVNSAESCLPTRLSELESSIWWALHKMETDENNADNHSDSSSSSKRATSERPDFSNESATGEQQRSDTVHAIDETLSLCDHERAISDSNNGNIAVRLKLDNDEQMRDELTETVRDKAHEQASPLGVDWRKETFSSFDSDAAETQTEEAPETMRAAKDLVKLSVPSLSSLQYLPGQLDCKPARFVDQSLRTMDNPKPEETSAFRPRIDLGDKKVRESTEKPTATREVSLETAKPSNSCLLHRLCLCNCMAQDQSDDATHGRQKMSSSMSLSEQRQTAPTGVLPSSRCNSPEHQDRDKSSHGCRRVPPSPSSAIRELESTNLEDLRDEEDTFARTVERANKMESKSVTKEFEMTEKDAGGPREKQLSRAGPRSKQHEKREGQSLAFLNLLKPTSRVRDDRRIDESRIANRKSPSQEGVKENLRGRHRVHSDKNELTLNFQRAPHSVRSDGLGSIGDLLTSGRSSSASGGTNSDVCSPFRRPNIRSDESPSRKSGPRSADLLSNASEIGRQNLSPENPVGKSSRVCHCCKQHFETFNHRSRLRSLRKLLTPNKLFTSESNICEHLDSEAGNHQLDHCETKSFLSRSLSRLSKRGQQKRTKRKSDDDARPSSACTSLDNSLSNTSHPDTFSDSINSLEEIGLAQSLPFEINRELLIYKPSDKPSPTHLFKAPEIVLSRVEYQNADEAQRIAEMAASTKGSAHQFPDIRNHARRDSEYDHRLTPSPDRPGSRMSFASDSKSTEGLNQGPFSTPCSPRSSRRNRPRSPRLSQSPIPFHSPASESTKIEDGLKVCSTEHFEKHISNIKDDQIEAQKQLFTAWINYHAPNLIRGDLFDELKDGIKLIGLLAALTHDKTLASKYKKLMNDKETYVDRLVLSPGGQMRNLSNISFAVDYLRRNLGMRLINLNTMDILSGKANVILGICWNIILHFQLDRDLLLDSDSNSLISGRTSPSPSDAFTSAKRSGKNQSLYSTQGQLGEYSERELSHAKAKLVAHINKRFNLKLTNLTSSLVDGDVLLAIIKQLASPSSQIGQPVPASWAIMSDDEKLDQCFELANKYLNVPILISASDLRRQTTSEGNTKPLLVYLSMLLKSNPRDCSTDQMLELRQVDESLRQTSVSSSDTKALNVTDSTRMASTSRELTSKEEILQAIQAIQPDDSLYIHNLQSTLARINQVDKAIQQVGETQFDRDTLRSLNRFKEQAEQIEALIDWINRADKLFQSKQKSSSDLAKTIEEYGAFFKTSNLPHVDATLCPTLERQYRECLATAKQRVLSMDQTMKNWISYEQACRDLKDWLKTAEQKLTDSLRPEASSHVPQFEQTHLKPSDPVDPICHYSDRLADLIDFFELESVDLDDLTNTNRAFLPNSFPDEVSTSSLNNSLSSSLLSLGSNTSRFSALTSSKKATYRRLFDDFELKCRLLAAMLEPDQRDNLLISVKELKSRLKYIIDNKVPQVLNEIRLSIDRCEMSIKEQDEICSEFGDDDDVLERKDFFDEQNLGDIGDGQKIPESDKAEVASDQRSTQVKLLNNTKRNKTKSKAKARNKSSTTKSSASSKTLVRLCAESSCSYDDDDGSIPFYRVLWKKICRASRVSMSLNIVLLICLAGICIIPLIQKDACCELSQLPIPADKLTINQRPT